MKFLPCPARLPFRTEMSHRTIQHAESPCAVEDCLGCCGGMDSGEITSSGVELVDERAQCSECVAVLCEDEALCVECVCVVLH